MKLKFINWNIYSLGIVIFVTFLPYIGIAIKTLSTSNMQVYQYIERVSNAECGTLIGVSCKKAVKFKSFSNVKGTSLVIGIPTNSAKYACISNNIVFPIYPASMIGSIAEFKNLEHDCDYYLGYFDENKDAAFSSWYLPVTVVIKSEDFVKVANAIQFYRSDLRTILGIVIPILAIMLLILTGLLGSRSQIQHPYSYAVAIVMTIVNGGIAERALFLPAFIGSPTVKEFFGLLLVLSFLFNEIENRWRKALTLILLSSVIVMMLHFFDAPKIFVWTMIIVGWAISVKVDNFSFVAKTFFSLNLFYLLSVVTIYNIVPPYAGTLFFIVYYIGLQFEQLRLKLLNGRVFQNVKKVDSDKKLYALIKLISRTFNIERISLAFVTNDGFENLVFDFTSQIPKKLKADRSSDVIAKVFAAGKPLLHLNAQTDSLGSRVSSKRSHYASNYFSSVPLLINGQIIGVISFSNYDRMLMHRAAIQALREALIELAAAVANGYGKISNKFANEFEQLFISMIDTQENKTLVKSIPKVLDEIYNKYAISGYFAEVKENNIIQLISASGRMRKELDVINALSFKVNTQNDYGPIAIAFKDDASVVLQNWRPITDKISMAAADIYRRTSAHSIITIPISIDIGTKKLRYLLWLQTDDQYSFGSDFFRVCKNLKIKLTELIAKDMSQLAANSLFNLAHADDIFEIVRGEKNNKHVEGRLVMLDLSQSTALSKALSIEKYNQIKEQYERLCTKYLLTLNFKLQMVIGDALIFTENTNNLHKSSAMFEYAVVAAESEVKDMVHKFLPDFYSSELPSLRACIVFGDITCGYDSAVGGGWKVLGSALNEVHKLEAVAKKYRNGIIFGTDSLTVKNTNYIRAEYKMQEESITMSYMEFQSRTSKKAS